MRYIFTILLLPLLLASSAWAKDGQLLSFTNNTLFQNLERAAKGTDFSFSLAQAKQECQLVCVASQSIDTDSFFMTSFNKTTQATNDATFIIQLTYKDQTQVLEGITRAAQALNTAARLINPDIKDTDLKKLQQAVGVTAKGLLKGQSKETIYNGVKLSAMFMQGCVTSFLWRIRRQNNC